jgi:hypothetical protein
MDISDFSMCDNGVIRELQIAKELYINTFFSLASFHLFIPTGILLLVQVDFQMSCNTVDMSMGRTKKEKAIKKMGNLCWKY